MVCDTVCGFIFVSLLTDCCQQQQPQVPFAAAYEEELTLLKLLLSFDCKLNHTIDREIHDCDYQNFINLFCHIQVMTLDCFPALAKLCYPSVSSSCWPASRYFKLASSMQMHKMYKLNHV